MYLLRLLLLYIRKYVSCYRVMISQNMPDTLSKGVIDISADETYQPIIEEQLQVFDSSFPDAKITIHYKPEAECFKDYFDNKARIILVTRGLTKAEKAQCANRGIYTRHRKLLQEMELQ